MIKKACCLFIFLSCGLLLEAQSKDALAVQQMRLVLDQMNYQLHSHNVEIELFQERLEQLENFATQLNKQLKVGPKTHTLEGRFSKLEKAHETLISDFKNLKNHLSETHLAVGSCQAKLSEIDKQLSSDVNTLKQSLQSILTFLQKHNIDEKEEYYTVKPGDSLGQIALEHKTDIKSLKYLNELGSDTIYVGQKLLLPVD